MPSITHEINLENEIEEYLLKKDWVSGKSKDYDKNCGIDTVKLFEFIKNTQAAEWEQIIQKYGDNAEESFLKRLNKEISNKGMLKVLREGFRDAPSKFRVMYIKPASTMNQTDINNYEKNILSITRQLHYSDKNENSVDMALFINGMPFATIELKNGFNQKVEDAITQYKYDRDQRELLFNAHERALVHFAVDPDEVYMTTKLNGSGTHFLPFNKGDNHGKGNPINPKGSKTSYLWEYILQKDSIIDILHRFIHIDEGKYSKNIKTKEEKRIIFPRYHQLDVVRKLIKDVKNRRSGENYLIQHSAGSGKSNSIAWLAHHLQNLHDNNNKIIFNSVIVITDRRILDNQLQDTIYQFDHVDGVVEKIDNNSKQLENALMTGKKIIITTLQKFTFIDMLATLKKVESKYFAIIIDEAHSSQAGESHTKMKATLGSGKSKEEIEEMLEMVAKQESEEEAEKEKRDIETQINNEMSKQGKLKNLSFFAFTATPKPKTLEIFGVKGENNIPHAFHTYSMKQAIEEGFILDVLKYYKTYQTYFKLSKSIADNPEYNKKLANKAIAKYMNIHSYNLSQKTEIMIEYFRTVTRHKIGNKAKAMLVTSSRLHALRYYYAFKEYIKVNNCDSELKILIAFSGEIDDDGHKATEAKLNGIKESEVPQKFHDEYQILIVAEKYQTGFDEPLLHTMFVDKPLSGVKAVQTLSRINRIHPLKEDTFILDFVNDTETIKKAFEPYYKTTEIDETTDLNIVYDIKSELENYHIYWQSEIDDFTKVFFGNAKEDKNNYLNFSKIQPYINPAVDRYNEKSESEQEDFKSLLIKFVRNYAFITNMVALNDAELHKFHAYAKILLAKLPYLSYDENLNLDREVTLAYYRLQSTYEGAITLENAEALSNSKHAGKSSIDDTKYFLSEIIKKINENFGTDFDEKDKLFVEQLYNILINNDEVKIQAKNNTIEHLKYSFKNHFQNSMISVYNKNKLFANKVLENEKIFETLSDYLLKIVYTYFNEIN